jgi:hypothetical protein
MAACCARVVRGSATHATLGRAGSAAAQLNEESLNLTNDERNDLAESERAEKDRGTLDRIQRAVWRLRFVVVIETALIVVLLIILIAR